MGAESGAFAVALILLLVSVAGIASAGPATPGPLTTDDRTASTGPVDLLAAAHASAAAGAGPGAISPAPATAHPSLGPNVSIGVAMTYDSADGYVVAVSLNATSGANGSTYGPSEMTWKFSHGNWSVIPTNGTVPATMTPGLVYDARDGYVVLYGGYLTGTLPAVVTNQTWSYRGGTWSNLTSTSSAPTAVDFSNLVFDAFDNYVVLFDEFGLSGNPNGALWETWSFANGTWSNLTATAGPAPPSFFGGMTYDARDQCVLYFGGETLADQLTNATWTFRGGHWSNVSGNTTNAPGGRLGFGITYDSVRQAVLLYGGLVQLLVSNASEYGGDTWTYANGTWSQIASNGTVYNPQGWNTPSMNMVYDPADNETVLFGANLSFVSLTPVTWTLSSATWTIAAPVFASAAMTTDVGHAVTFAVTQPLGSGRLTYDYSGLPPGCLPADAASLQCAPTSVGSYRVVATITGPGGYDAVTTTRLTVDPAPAILRFGESVPVGEVGIPVGFNVTAANGTGPLAYAFTGLPAGCASVDAAQVSCVPAAAGQFTVSATVTDSVGVSAFGSLALTVAPALEVTSLVAIRPALDVGQSISVATGLAGGVGPFAYEYAGLPAGCGSAPSATLTCRPVATGVFSITVSADDSLRASASGTTSVVVNPLPSVTALAVSNDRIPSGGSVQLTAHVSGGTAPFHYAYEGLPPGCTAATGPMVSCSGVPSGRYTVVVNATDATGASATASAAFTAAPSHGPTGTAGGRATGSAVAEFWWGLAVGGVAVATAAILGWHRLRLAREGEEIVRELRGPSGIGPAAQPAPGDDLSGRSGGEP